MIISSTKVKNLIFIFYLFSLCYRVSDIMSDMIIICIIYIIYNIYNIYKQN